MIRRSGQSKRRAVRVCFLIDTLATAGVETQLVRLISQLDRSKIAPYLAILYPYTERAAALAPEDCQIHWIGLTTSLRHPSAIWHALKFARFLRRNRIDVLCVDLPASTQFGVPVGWLARVPRLIRTRRDLGYWMTPRERWIARCYSHLVDLTIVNSEACRRAALEIEKPRPESVVILKNDIDLRSFQSIPSPVEHSSRSRRGVGIVANLRPVKAPELFIEAAARIVRRHDDVVFRMVGKGDMRPKLEQQIATLGLTGRVELCGRVADLPAFLEELDIAVLCSHSEGMSCVLLEYMAAARPIVATRVGGAEEVIDHETHGLLVPPGNPEALADAIERLLRNRRLAVRLAEAARSRVTKEYGGPNIGKRFESLVFQTMRIPDASHASDAAAGDGLATTNL